MVLIASDLASPSSSMERLSSEPPVEFCPIAVISEADIGNLRIEKLSRSAGSPLKEKVIPSIEAVFVPEDVLPSLDLTVQICALAL